MSDQSPKANARRNAFFFQALIQTCAAQDLSLTLQGDYDSKEYLCRIGQHVFHRGKTMLEAVCKALDDMKAETGLDIIARVSDRPWEDDDDV